jgi:hypothetical protein
MQDFHHNHDPDRLLAGTRSIRNAEIKSLPDWIFAGKTSAHERFDNNLRGRLDDAIEEIAPSDPLNLCPATLYVGKSRFYDVVNQ